MTQTSETKAFIMWYIGNVLGRFLGMSSFLFIALLLLLLIRINARVGMCMKRKYPTYDSHIFCRGLSDFPLELDKW